MHIEPVGKQSSMDALWIFCTVGYKRVELVKKRGSAQLDPPLFLILLTLLFLQLKGTYRRTGIENPYTQHNVCKNFASIVCGPFPPRYSSLSIYVLVYLQYMYLSIYISIYLSIYLFINIFTY